jgi:hypothetical protein
MTPKHLSMIAALGFIAIGTAAGVHYGSLWGPESRIRASLLKSTPLGSGKTAVKAVMQKRGWPESASLIGGYIAFKPSGPVFVTTINGTLGRYAFPHRTVVEATWEFDTNNHLVDIRVEKAGDD